MASIEDRAPFRMRRNLRDALEDGTLEVKLQYHAENARQPRIHADRTIQRQDLAGRY